MAPRRKPEAPLTIRDNEFIGDMAAWRTAHSEDNSEQLERLRRSLRSARNAELTPRQQQMLRMYYDEGKSMTRSVSTQKGYQCIDTPGYRGNFFAGGFTCSARRRWRSA